MGLQWRYMVLMACYFGSVLELGGKSFGVLLLYLQDDLHTDSMTLGAWMSTAQALSFIFGPIITQFIHVIGERPIIIFGGLLAGSALVGASFVKSVTPLGICLCLNGIGFGMTYIPRVSAISVYFNDNSPNTALGFMSTGGATGMMLIPPLTQFMIHIFGWRGALFLLGGFSFNTVVCGALIRPLIRRFKRPDEKSHLLSSTSTSIQMESDSSFESSGSFTESSGFSSESSSDSSSSSKSSDCATKLPCYYSLLQCLEFIANFFRTLRHVFINTPKFIPIPIYVFFSGACIAGWLIFLVPHLVSKGLSPEEGASIAAIGGIGLIIGRILPGPILDRKYLSAINLGLILFFLNAATFFMDFTVTTLSYWPFAVLALFNGLFCGTQSVIYYAICMEMLPDYDVLHGFAIGTLFFALGNLVTGFIMGHFLSTGRNSFMVLGLFALASAIVLLICVTVPIISSFFRKSKTKGDGYKTLK